MGSSPEEQEVALHQDKTRFAKRLGLHIIIIVIISSSINIIIVTRS